jgi:hypothetical protein
MCIAIRCGHGKKSSNTEHVAQDESKSKHQNCKRYQDTLAWGGAWPENPPKWILLSLDILLSVLVYFQTGDVVLYSYLMSLDPAFLLLNTDCPEVIGLVPLCHCIC